MKSFAMCPVCLDEYENPQDGRFHSQTNSCHDCGMELSIFPGQEGTGLQQGDLIDLAVSMLQDRKILAVKATSGFLLLADATAPSAILTLRERKKRPRKPLALMVADTHMLADYFLASDQEKEWMQSASRPIVLCKPKKTTDLSQSKTLIAPGLSLLGVCLPADPLMFLLAKKMGRPIISTSGNLHQSPVQSENADAIKNLYGIADAVLLHNREIHFAQDDSVGRVATASKKKIILRRSRGLAPTFWNVSDTPSEKCTLAMGADLKSSFALWEGKHVFVSQYLGNLESFETQLRYLQVLRGFLEITGKEPAKILVDRHPGYHSRRLATLLPTAEVLEVPHHEAHFAALLWEHSLLDTDEPVLGVVWDGLGFGNDGSLWGSEFFVFQEKNMAHLAGFEYFDMLLGDKMSKEPRLAALSLCHHADMDPAFLKRKFTNQEWSLYAKLLQKPGHAQTNSMGRIFDAVSSILDITDFNTFEGEAAMHLEQKAQQYIDANDWKCIPIYSHRPWIEGRISLSDLLVQILKDKLENVDQGLIAAKFHLTLVSIVRQIVEKTEIRNVGFSGGVFQNALLVDLLTQALGGSCRLLFHEQLSPNDENIALGQLAWMHIQEKSQTNKINSYVFSDTR
jgi:hydrogenase maturation protein HypF